MKKKEFQQTVNKFVLGKGEPVLSMYRSDVKFMVNNGIAFPQVSLRIALDSDNNLVLLHASEKNIILKNQLTINDVLFSISVDDGLITISNDKEKYVRSISVIHKKAKIRKKLLVKLQYIFTEYLERSMKIEHC